jgi:uncharacterized membrane protein
MIYVLLLITLAGTVAAQLLLKKGLIEVGRSPSQVSEVIPFLLGAFTNLYILAAMFSVLVTALAWIFALSKGELSHLYPFMGLSFVLVALFSLIIFKEDVTALRWVGIIVICLGVFLVSRS